MIDPVWWGDLQGRAPLSPAANQRGNIRILMAEEREEEWPPGGL